jgi:hypothetical protein
MTPTILVAGALALMSTANLLLQSFDLTDLEDMARRASRRTDPPQTEEK